LVHAQAFSFCLPESWRPTVRTKDSTDATQWRGATASVKWGLGHPRSFIADDVVLKVTYPIVSGSNPGPIPQDPPPECSRRSTPLTPGGVSLVITVVECQRQWTITAWSTERAIYVQGESRSATAAGLLEHIMSTIQFSPNR
jgi:hypothetical protein